MSAATIGTTDRAARPSAAWILPAALFFGLFAGLPLLLVIGLSFTSWDGLGTPEFIGLDNWSRALSDPEIFKSLRITLTLTVVGWAVQTSISLLLGVWAAGRQRNRAVLSSIFFLPLLLSTAATALVWQQAMLDPNFGLAATLGPPLGFEQGNIIGTGGGAMFAIVMVVSWQFVPFHTLLYQAAARQIPQVLYDAATVDGAGRAGQFRHVTLPHLRNTIVTSTVLIVVGSLTYFETVLILTDGGPGTDSSILPHRMYVTGFRAYEMGYASVIAAALVVLATALSVFIVRFTGFAKMRSTLEGL